jgi:hypothetical protein
MTFTEVFGGTTIYPSGVSYRAVALSANQTLAWPVETATNANIVAQIMDVTPSIAALSILMPPANEASVGETTLFFNAGSFAFTVKDNGGNTIVSIAPGLSYQVYLIGNSTVNGTWRSTQYAAGTSSATAGSLVGAGIKAINTTLNQSMTVTSLNSNYIIGDADRSEAFLWSGGAGTLTLPSAVTVGNDWFCHVRNGGTGAISLATTGGQLINGASSLAFNPGDSAIVICDGSGFFTIGFGQSASFAFDYVSIDLTSQTSPYTLAGANLNRIAYSFGGTLTANMTIHIPATFQQYWLANETLGGFAITVKVAGQTGVIIGNGVRAICYCNGTDLVDADTSSFSFPVSISQGGTGATNESGARVNLGGTSTGIAIFTSPSAASARSTLSAAVSGANNDITSLTGLTTPLSVGQGGTGTATAFTSGSVVFSGASGVYTQDNANFFWDDTNNRLGVGTAAPANKFVVSNSGAAGFEFDPSAGIFQTYNRSTSAYTGLLTYALEQRFFTGASPTEKMRVSASGDVGIGTAAPSYKLEVRTDAASGFNWVASNNNTATGGFGAGFLTTTGAGSSYFYMRGDGVTYVENASNNPLAFATNALERVRITNGGDLLVGTITTQGKLTVASATGNVGLNTGTSASPERGNLWYDTDGSGWNLNIGKRQGGAFTAQMTFQDNGSIGIGTTAPQSKLHVSGGYVTAGNVSSTAGSRIIGGDYSGAEHITTFGSEFSSGGPVIGYGVWPSTASALAFVSSAAPALQRAAYTQTGNNHVWFTGASQTVAVGSAVTMAERMRLDGSGNLGLGTAPSGVRLDVNGSIRTTVGSGGTLSLFETDATRANQLFSGADASGSFINATFSTGGVAVLRLQTANNERMRITAAGDVGIGTISPASRLHAAGITRISDATNSTAVAIDASTTAGLTSIIAQFGGSQLALGSAGTERVRIDASGNVGIGTLSPGSPLDVLTNSSALGVAIRGRASDNVGSLALRSNDGATIYGQVQGRSTDFRIDVGSSNVFTVYTSSTERFRITSTGGITSSDLADAVGYKGLPQNSQTASYTLALSDMGKHISITTGGVVIPANGAVAFPIGSAVTIFNNSGSNQTISITTDTLRQAGTANTGSRTLAQYGVATVLKVTSTVWVISGAGVS